MRKIFLIVIVAILVITAVQGGTGIKAGFGYSNVGNGSAYVIRKMNYKAGVSGDYDFCRCLSFRSAAYFSSRGYDYRVNETVVSNRIYYLEMPVMLVGKIHCTPCMRVTVSGGGYLAMGVSGLARISCRGYVYNKDIFEDVIVEGHPYKLAENFDYGLAAGVGVELYFLEIGLNYDLGLRDAYLITNGDTAAYLRNGNLWLSLALRF
ncbi:MAG: PorT family protein [Bacteroidales bacterium]|jgi:hypothetical protein|nr:PorT family protein [Bacteroidales bacterium]